MDETYALDGLPLLVADDASDAYALDALPVIVGGATAEVLADFNALNISA